MPRGTRGACGDGAHPAQFMSRDPWGRPPGAGWAREPAASFPLPSGA